LSEDDLKEAKLGFRARYVAGFARRGADGDLDAWCGETDSDLLRSALLGVKGIGSYAANHLLMLLGHYGEIPCDSEVREHLGVSPKGAEGGRAGCGEAVRALGQVPLPDAQV
jgi:3-methyladenine DNA glycosylase/8-oxoguanine DNA glycosylase